MLALPDCARGELEEQWRALWGTEPPRHGSREFLIRAVAYGIQAQAFGGLDAKTLQLLRKANGANGARPKPRRSRLGKGSKLFREWHGETHEVLVLDKGFAWRGETYPSLSAIARAITGAHWNGWAFFGLKRPQRRRRQMAEKGGGRARRLRCAIYTRKSSDEGLEQEFNSLHAQREACEAFIASQRHEGWHVLSAHYDDGGFSGGTMDRPALQRLLADIGAGKIDVVVVYKIDRLTRSLFDFAKIVEAFDAKGVSFVSVTQQFNTTTSMGRLTLNVLLSFAQFEREVTSERIRDKIAASKQKGMWMGGAVPLGYDAVNRKLRINAEEAKTVRLLFELYLKLGSVRQLQEECQRLGLRTKLRTMLDGRQSGGTAFSRGHLYRILSNPIYIGRIPHKGRSYEGEHDAIIDAETWDKVQAQLAMNAGRKRGRASSKHPSLLAGLLFTAEGVPFTPSHAVNHGRRYRYYVERSLLTPEAKKGKSGAPQLNDGEMASRRKAGAFPRTRSSSLC